MLEPERRQLLLDAIRPPAGYVFDRAVGTTYSLNLLSLLTTPLGFSLLDREADDGRLVADPIALLNATRQHADRIDIFCQAGQIAVPSNYRPLLTYLESSVHEATPPAPDAIFHAKLWALRYRQHHGDGTAYRLLCLSRNLTFDRSWDTVLRLDGRRVPYGRGNERLSQFVRALPSLSVRSLPSERIDPIVELAYELESVIFELPAGFERIAFWPLGLDGPGWPFGRNVGRRLIMSPFVSRGCLGRLAAAGARTTVVSTPEAFDSIGAEGLARFDETLVMASEALPQDATGVSSSPDGPPGQVDEAIAERTEAELHGLHAKLYLFEGTRRARIWTGSANATDAAFNGNVEFLVELEGPAESCGVDSVIGERVGGLRTLLEPYRPQLNVATEPTPAEELERKLDKIRRAVATLNFIAQINWVDDDLYDVQLRIAPAAPAESGHWWEIILQGAEFQCRPLTLADAFLRAPQASEAPDVTVDFGNLSFPSLTSYFVVELKLREDGHRASAAFIVNAVLEGAPTDRRERTLASLLANSRELVRFLLLLLGDLEAVSLGSAIDVLTGDETLPVLPWTANRRESLLEPMVRALAVDPERLDEIHALVLQLQATEAGSKLLPEEWRSIWAPIWEAREELRRP